MTGWPWLWPPSQLIGASQDSKGSLAFESADPCLSTCQAYKDHPKSTGALPETLVSPATMARHDQGKEGLLAVLPDTRVLFPGLGPSTCPKAAASQKIIARELVGRKPRQRLLPGVPRARAPGIPGGKSPSPVCRAHHSGRGAPGLPGFPPPALPTNPETSKNHRGLLL